MTPLRPFFSYFGSKWKLAPRYPVPEHSMIVEPFAGSAGYATQHADREVVLVEKSAQLAALWRWLTRVSVDEVLALPLDATRLDGICDEASALIRFWCARGRSAPARTVGTRWMQSGQWPSSFWGEYARERIAAQVPLIRHWRVIEGDYTAAPDVEATWFIDPPYVGARHYPARVGDYRALGEWCRVRRGLAIVCEQEGADWLPFAPFKDCKSMSRGSYREVVWVQRQRISARVA